MLFHRHGSAATGSRPLRCFFIQTGFGTAFTYLTSGVFLSGLALLMGAGDVIVSYLSVIVNICGVLILLFSPVLERFQSRKRLTVGLTVLSRLTTLFIVCIPVIAPPGLRLPLLLAAVVAAFTLQAQTTVVLNQWMLGFMDERRSGRYISRRQTLTLAVTVALSLAGGWWMDVAQGRYEGFAALFALAGLMGICEVVLLVRTPDGPACHSAVKGFGLRELVRLPLQNRPFAGFVLYIFTFYLLLYIADSFTMVYLMKYLALPYGTVNLLYMIISLPQIVLLGLWGRLSDRRGHRFVLKTSIWLFTGETLFMAFAGPEGWPLFIPIAFLCSSAANSGFAVAVFNRRYELMPGENRIVYDNFYSAAVGAAFILGPMAGGAIKGAVESALPAGGGVPFAGIRVLYIVSAVGILLLQTVCCRPGRGGVRAPAARFPEGPKNCDSSVG